LSDALLIKRNYQRVVPKGESKAVCLEGVSRETVTEETDLCEVDAPTTGRSGTGTLEVSVGMWERIARRAYELWRDRGCRDGYTLQDWLDAEGMVMEEIYEARK
jgi:hypothetical protein